MAQSHLISNIGLAQSLERSPASLLARIEDLPDI